MKNELEIEEEGTVAIAYLKSTEERIINALKQEANYSMKEVTEQMIVKIIENEKRNIVDQNIPQAIAERMMSLLNVIEQRLLHNIGNLAAK